jgi:translation initiation factor 2-alpha kinase 3
MSMFRSAADISSSDPEFSSGSENENEGAIGQEQQNHAEPGNPEEQDVFDNLAQLVEDEDVLASNGPGNEHGLGGTLDLDSDGHATVMTSALLEFFCLSRAAEILNGQPGSHGRYTRDSPEVKYLGKKMYTYQSQFLSSHGVVAGGIEGEDWGTTRQHYRDSLDMLGHAALEGMNLGVPPARPPSRGAIVETRYASPSDRQLVPTAITLSKTNAETSHQSVWDLQRRISSKGMHQRHLGHGVNFTSLLQRPQTLPRQPSGPLRLIDTHQTPVLDRSSRYALEFSEIRVLGRGSFGQVFEVRNHVDGQNYAIKKISLSQERLEKLQHGGIHHLEHIMKEIRTLARLEHKNVVRYYGAWAEQTPVVSETQPLDGTRDVQTNVETLSEDPADEEQSFGIVFEQSDDAVVFEDDDSKSASIYSSSGRADSGSNERQRRNSRLTVASSRSKKSSVLSTADEDDDVESIPRYFSIPEAGHLSQGHTSTWGDTDGDIFTDGMSEDPSKMQVRYNAHSPAPAVVLHIQMSLHPLTLSTFLSPRPGSQPVISNSSSPRHCFHLLPSLKLLLGILSGVEYLHSKGIVHRDLKPANIFLSMREDGRNACRTCMTQNEMTQNPYRPRIGDFGLVTDIPHCTDPTTTDAVMIQDSPTKARHVGTEFYCPPRQDSNASHAANENIIDEKLDVFALGVILFELVYGLRTKMERQMVLFELTRNGKPGRINLPADFATKVDCAGVKLANDESVADSIAACIKGMLEFDYQKRWRCADVRKSLEHLVAMVDKNSSE